MNYLLREYGLRKLIMQNPMDTDEYKLLVADLENHKTTNPKAYEIIKKNMETGLYGDFTSTHPTPKLKLCADLKDAKWTDLYTKALRGDYDF